MLIDNAYSVTVFRHPLVTGLALKDAGLSFTCGASNFPSCRKGGCVHKNLIRPFNGLSAHDRV